MPALLYGAAFEPIPRAKPVLIDIQDINLIDSEHNPVNELVENHTYEVIVLIDNKSLLQLFNLYSVEDLDICLKDLTPVKAVLTLFNSKHEPEICQSVCETVKDMVNRPTWDKITKVDYINSLSEWTATVDTRNRSIQYTVQVTIMFDDYLE